jgi:preprotein translocase subunit YajC
MTAADIQALLTTLLPLVAFFGIMYLLIIKPQKKKEKTRKDMQNSVNVGDEIVSIGGIMGKIINIKDDEITIETSVERTQIKLFRYAIDSVTKTTEQK